MNSEKYKIKLTEKLLDIVKIAKSELDYNPSQFLTMLNEFGGYETAIKLIQAKHLSYGFEKMWEKGRLDLTVEAVVLQGPWKILFRSNELNIARKRLFDLGYKVNEFDIDDISRNGQPWSVAELKAIVQEYISMLEKEIQNKKYSKSEINRELRTFELHGRSKGSVEYRMQNISAVLEAYNMRWINGYKPAQNLGPKAFEEISDILTELRYINEDDYLPTADNAEYEMRVSRLQKKINRTKPAGIENPEQIKNEVKSYKRDPSVKAWVLNEANGSCERCGKPGPFKRSDGTVYLEVHHINAIAEGGQDTVENVVALCPNCHRMMHYADNRQEEKIVILQLRNNAGGLKNH